MKGSNNMKKLSKFIPILIIIMDIIIIVGG
ncbi:MULTISPECIES: SHP2/SHP3 family peptide pheromone [Streptococcus]